MQKEMHVCLKIWKPDYQEEPHLTTWVGYLESVKLQVLPDINWFYLHINCGLAYCDSGLQIPNVVFIFI